MPRGRALGAWPAWGVASGCLEVPVTPGCGVLGRRAGVAALGLCRCVLWTEDSSLDPACGSLAGERAAVCPPRWPVGAAALPGACG